MKTKNFKIISLHIQILITKSQELKTHFNDHSKRFRHIIQNRNGRNI